MRINKFLAECGVGSRRHADELIKDSHVKINGKIARLGDEVDELNDKITVDGSLISKIKSYDYYVMNKPKGYVCTVSDDKGRKTVMDLLPNLQNRVYPVGRLDYDSEGLLFFTNDGDFANRLTHPRNEIPKTYLVKIEGNISDYDINKLRGGITYNGEKFKKAKVVLLEENKSFTKFHITIYEGKNREIRKMFEAIKKEVVFLKRIKIADFELHGLNRGEVRKLTKEEIEYLKNV